MTERVYEKDAYQQALDAVAMLGGGDASAQHSIGSGDASADCEEAKAV